MIGYYILAAFGIICAVIGCAGNLYLIYHRDDEEEQMSALEHRVLNRAADMIEARGWRQGMSASIGGPVCAGEAFDLALDEEVGIDYHPTRVQVMMALANRLGVVVPLHGAMDAIVHWNDDPRRTEAEVLATLRGTA